MLSFMMKKFIILLIAFLTSASCDAQNSIPDLDFPETTATRIEFISEKKLGFLNRQIDLYNRNSKDSEEVKELAIPFLQTAIERFAGVLEHSAKHSGKWSQLEASGRILVEAECSDPIVFIYYSDALLENNKYWEARKAAERALKLFESSEYPKGLSFLAHYQMYRVFYHGPWVGDKRVKSTLAKLIETSPMWFDYADDYRDGGQVAWDLYLDAVLLDNRRTFLEEPAKRAIEVYADAEAADQWVVSMMRAKYYRGVAWLARGGSFSSQVEKEGWELFAENMKLASVHARNAFKTDPQRPDAPAFLIEIAMAGHDEDTIFQWFERTIKAEIDYPIGYLNLLSALAPRWGGSHEAMLEFGRQCAATERYDTSVPRFFLDTFYRIIQDNRSITWVQLMEDEALFAEVEKTIEGLVKDPSRQPVGDNDGRKFSKDQAWLLSQLVGISENSNRFDKSAKLWQRLGDEVSDHWLQSFSLNKAYHPGRAQAAIELGDTMVDEVLPVLNLIGRDLESATSGLKSIESWLGKMEGESAKVYFRLWQRLARQAIKFHEGEWVDIEFTPGIPEWHQRFGTWKFESPASILADNRKTIGNGFQKMYYRLNFPGDKEIEFSLAKGEINSTALGGVALGEYSYRNSGRLFFADWRRKRLGVNIAGKDPNSTAVSSLSPILVRMWTDGKYEMFSDGNRVTKLTQDKGFRDEGKFGLSTGHRVNWAGQLRFQNIRLRKITTLPKPAYGEDEKLVEYYSQQIDRNAKDLIGYAQRGISLHRLGRHKEAIEDLERCNKGNQSFRTNHVLGQSLCRTGNFERGLELLSKNVGEIRMRLEDRHRIYQRFEHIALLSLSESWLAQELVLNHTDQQDVASVAHQFALDSEAHRKLLGFFSDGKTEDENQLRAVTKQMVDFEGELAMVLALNGIGESTKAREAVASLRESELTENQLLRLTEIAGVIGIE